jgi:hypothetical protein
MQVIAKVFDIEITKRDLERECARMKKDTTDETMHLALEHLIDRCLLYAKANQCGCEVTDTEYDNALMDLLDQDEPLGLSSDAIQELGADELENLLKRHLMIKKYINFVSEDYVHITPQKLQEFYEEQKEIFLRGECVRCSHILIRHSKDSEQRIKELRSRIHNEAEFNSTSKQCSDCPSNVSCGDLGWFHRGKMINEIDSVAFSMKVGEISQPFQSNYGYHIIMLTDRKEASYIPFEDIKESLSTRLKQIEKEFVLSKHISDLRNQYATEIEIIDLEFIA